MIRNNKRIMKESKCSVCGYPVMADEYNNGDDACLKCGWRQDGASIEISDMPSPILISLDKARQLYKEGRPLKPDFADFIEAYEMYGEMQFCYNKERYGMNKMGGVVNFFSCDKKPNLNVTFATVEEFAAKANIGGVLLKDLWTEVENPYWLQ